MTVEIASLLQAIESDMQQVVCAPELSYAPLYAMLRYHLGWQDAQGAAVAGRRGKRLRPLLCLLACHAVGSNWQQALPAATALELIHNFTLIHDDIEDRGETRHDRPTVWTLWGVPQGVNAGDAMWALARRHLLTLSQMGHPAERVLAVVSMVEESCLELCQGQYLDMASEGDYTIDQERYLRMVRGKTAALTRACVMAGAMLGGAAPGLAEQMAVFGLELGIAFQITDDLLGIWGDSSVTGKSTATDLEARKMTLPIIHALAWERERGQQELVTLLRQPPSDGQLVPMLAVLERSGAREVCQRAIDAAQERMRDAWHNMHLQGPEAAQLYELACSLVGRQF